MQSVWQTPSDGCLQVLLMESCELSAIGVHIHLIVLKII